MVLLFWIFRKVKTLYFDMIKCTFIFINSIELANYEEVMHITNIYMYKIDICVGV
jgi:hypothetical protein